MIINPEQLPSAVRLQRPVQTLINLNNALEASQQYYPHCTEEEVGKDEVIRLRMESGTQAFLSPSPVLSPTSQLGRDTDPFVTYYYDLPYHQLWCVCNTGRGSEECEAGGIPKFRIYANVFGLGICGAFALLGFSGLCWFIPAARSASHWSVNTSQKWTESLRMSD